MIAKYYFFFSTVRRKIMSSINLIIQLWVKVKAVNFQRLQSIID